MDQQSFLENNCPQLARGADDAAAEGVLQARIERIDELCDTGDFLGVYNMGVERGRELEIAHFEEFIKNGGLVRRADDLAARQAAGQPAAPPYSAAQMARGRKMLYEAAAAIFIAGMLAGALLRGWL